VADDTAIALFNSLSALAVETSICLFITVILSSLLCQSSTPASPGSFASLAFGGAMTPAAGSARLGHFSGAQFGWSQLLR